MPSLRKVALFFLGLDLKTADLLMQRLDRATAQAVRREMLAMQDTTPQEIAAVSTEFVQKVHHCRIPKQYIDKYIDTLEISSPISVPAIKPVPEPQQPEQPFVFLQSVAPDVLAKIVAGESAQTLALVMAHIPTDVARELLATFPRPQQVEAMRRLSLLGEIDTEIVRDVADALRERFELLNTPTISRGLSSARQLLATLDNTTRDHILTSIDSTQRKSVTSPMLAELASLEDNELAETLSQVDSCLVMVAIAGSDAAFVHRVLQNYTHSEQRRLEQRLDAMRPITSRDISEARLALGHALRLRRQRQQVNFVNS